MNHPNDFTGFPLEAVTFFHELKLNNERTWFETHKEMYREAVLVPAQAFVQAMGKRLLQLSPNFNSDPRTNGAGSIFRIYRDIRFSSDKTPYKTHLGIFFWEGPWSKNEAPGFYFHLEPPKLILYAGIYTFTGPVLKAFRQALVNPLLGSRLVQTVQQLQAQGYQIGGEHYKKLPRGYTAEPECARFLLFNTLYGYAEAELPDELFNSDLVAYCFQRFQDLYPLHEWIVAMMATAEVD